MLATGARQSSWGPGGDRYTFLTTGAENNGTCFTLLATVPPGGGPPPHIHHLEDEFFYLLDGELTIFVAGHSVPAKAGDFVLAPKGVMHHYRNDGAITARMLAIFTPTGMEGWFAECLVPVTDQNIQPPLPTPQMIRGMIEAGPRHGVEWG